MADTSDTQRSLGWQRLGASLADHLALYRTTRRGILPAAATAPLPCRAPIISIFTPER